MEQTSKEILKKLWDYLATLSFLKESEENHSFRYTDETYRGLIQFNEDDTIDLAISLNETNENVYYMHLEPVKYETDLELIRKYFSYLRLDPNAPDNDDPGEKIHILIVCNLGMSAGYLTQMMEERLKDVRVDFVFEPISQYSMPDINGDDYDFIFLLPPTEYMSESLRNIYGDKVIRMKRADFSKWNVNHVVEAAIDLMKLKRGK